MSGHGGNLYSLAEQQGCRIDEILDFSANLNPLGPPANLNAVINYHLENLVHYPDPECSGLIKAISKCWHLKTEQIVAGNGTSELLFQLIRILPVHRAVIPVPSYIDYERACQAAELPIKQIYLNVEDDFILNLNQLESEFKPGDLVIIGQPNNPTGQLVDRQDLLKCIRKNPRVLFLIDEAFALFIPEYISLAGCEDNLIVLCSLTKIFAIPGLRLGFLVAAPDICALLTAKSAPWGVNTLAQAVGISWLGEDYTCRFAASRAEYLGFPLNTCEYMKETVAMVAEQRQQLIASLSENQFLHIICGAANFLLICSHHLEISGTVLAEQLLKQYRIAIRPCENYNNLDNRYFRVAVRSRDENNRLVRAITEIFHSHARRQGISTNKNRKNKKDKKKKNKKKTPALMLLGTGSDVGKSVLVAGLARVFFQDGVSVAPFKSQNMSLNSFVTRSGGEMGRAQVVQAQACRLEPVVQMNPVLLKPCSDLGSQIIVLGQPVGNMKVMDYIRYKEKIWQDICVSYDSLASEYDLVILEGAGSSGEVNLKSHDIVNGRMGQYAGARTLLVGDIDRGGVYASFIGHLMVMEPWERQQLAGYLINRFRGDASLLDDAHQYMLNQTGKPVLGVVPFLSGLGLPEEDSVSFKAGLFNSVSTERQQPFVEIAVIDFPHISNFTDLEPFLIEEDVVISIVGRVEDLGDPDAIIIPGSKNVIADLEFLKTSGLAEKILTAAGNNQEIVGICGGFQVLGNSIHDPHGLEGKRGTKLPGLQLLPMDTTLVFKKTLTRKSGLHLSSGHKISGYEIHHGNSDIHGEPILSFTDGSVCGLAKGRLWGSYLHGIFDNDDFRRWWINRLRQGRGMPSLARGATYDLEPALNRLADTVRDSVDMDKIYQLLDL